MFLDKCHSTTKKRIQFVDTGSVRYNRRQRSQSSQVSYTMMINKKIIKKRSNNKLQKLKYEESRQKGLGLKK